MFRQTKKHVLVALVVVQGLLAFAGSTGCDTYSSLLGMADYSGLGGYSFPSYGLYDPTADIQSVIDYRQSVMDWSNSAWDEYILQ